MCERNIHKFRNNSELKHCSTCNKWKSVIKFHKCSKYWDNLQSCCISCQRNYCRTPNGVYSIYKVAARRRNLSFKLTKIELAEIISQPCYYCGELQENFNGVDRIDNKKGYTPNNCVSCCSMCNRMKHIYNKEEFIMKCKAITEKQEVMSYR